ncbi:RluA family pseudouridine synthase [Peptacetobacter hominis]|uniref:Pseudouridine synthase n=1 Tax=Peptacetobacter hominis TaxID=2743610 RepID=A0A544QTT8_9FIRM|nr:RluA family pseudouridine synthase [Peptacetobacter hominis]TQQ84097.1 RluA family pseudouridine synthase [Peptacetobacter hominis]
MFKKEQQRYDLISYTSDENIKLKDLLIDKLNFSVRSISKMKRERTVTVNGVFRKPSLDVKSGETVEIKIDEEMSSFVPQKMDNMDILYDDFDIIMVNKPPFMVVHPTKSHADMTMANGVTDFVISKGEKVRIRFVNRLDMNTSGLVIVAKNAYAHHIMSTDMSENAVEKKYIAVVKGIIENNHGTINAPIYRPTDDSIKRVVDDRGQESITHYNVIERLNDATVVELKLETGRTHQIRVHLSHIGHGIIGDELYGYVDEKLIKRQALHAYSLKFMQPRTREELEFKAEIPEDMMSLIEKLR